MTYGWAILVVLAAIAALAYFGVLNPDRFLPEKCTLPSGLACLDFKGNTTQVTLVIQNSLGTDAANVSVRLTGPGCISATATPNNTAMINGNTTVFTFNAGCTPTVGKWRSTISYDYTQSTSGLSHTKTGEVILGIA